MHSDRIKRGPHRAPTRAMLKATGLSDADIERPLVAVVNTWSEVTPCNLHLRELAAPVKQALREFGVTPIEFNTIVVSDGISMGTPGMRASLASREVIADSIELAVRGHSLDAVLVLVGCDKTLPAAGMALARLDRPGLVLYGRTIAPGRVDGIDVSIQDVFEAVGRPPALTLQLLRDVVHEMLLVDEAEIAEAIALYASALHQLAEGAAATALAGARLHARSAGFEHVALILTGSNIETAALRTIISRSTQARASPGRA